MRILLSTLALFATLIGAGRADDAILVLDASGSMWGQIEGRSKVEIARAVIGDLLDNIPSDRRLGLTAYGHRREGDCSADPCALGADLEKAGVDFTAHVVGFGLASETESAGLKCLAEATGGKYFSAQNAGELGLALSQTIATAPPPAPKAARVILRATELAGGPQISSGLAWDVVPAGGGGSAFSKSDAGIVETELTPGDYEVRVSRASDGLKGKATFNAVAGAERTVTIPLELSLAASLAATPRDEAPAGSKVAVKWTGPNRAGDYVTVVKAGAPITSYLDYQYTERSNPAEIRMPVEPGDYELRYVLGAPQRILAAVLIKVVAVAATIGVPPEAPAGSTIDVTWTGPAGAGDWITVVKPADAPTAYNYFDAKPDRRTLRMPLESGDYEIRYVQGGQKVIARAPIKVTPVAATIGVPPEAPAGSTIDVAWTGPAGPGDWITVVKPADAPTAYNDYFDVKPDRRALRMPLQGGDYEVRYVQGGQKVIARAPIKVTPVAAKITAPPSVAAGGEFNIDWTGPNYRGDWLTIIKSDRAAQEYGSYYDSDKSRPGKLTAPTAPGSYEIRYVLGGKTIIARTPIEVIAP